MADVLRIANCSGFYGDRLSAAREMVEGGPIDVLTGDYLAELTLMILLKDRLKDPDARLRAHLPAPARGGARRPASERGIKIVVNAGGLNPAGLRRGGARALRASSACARDVAHVEGDDLLPQLADAAGARRARSRTSTRASPLRALQAPVLSGQRVPRRAGASSTALERGADVVICPRVTDAALTLGPAAWKFGWARDDWDRLAAGVVAGHIIECGAQCTGGNYTFFREVPGLAASRLPDRRDARRRQLRRSPSTRAPAAWSRSAR